MFDDIRSITASDSYAGGSFGIVNAADLAMCDDIRSITASDSICGRKLRHRERSSGGPGVALKLHIEIMQKSGDKIPTPRIQAKMVEVAA